MKKIIDILKKNTLTQLILSSILGSIFFLLDTNFGSDDDNILTYTWVIFYGITTIIILVFIVAGLIINPIKKLLKK
jgi:hypothetical protein